MEAQINNKPPQGNDISFDKSFFIWSGMVNMSNEAVEKLKNYAFDFEVHGLELCGLFHKLVMYHCTMSKMDKIEKEQRRARLNMALSIGLCDGKSDSIGGKAENIVDKMETGKNILGSLEKKVAIGVEADVLMPTELGILVKPEPAEATLLDCGIDEGNDWSSASSTIAVVCRPVNKRKRPAPAAEAAATMPPATVKSGDLPAAATVELHAAADANALRSYRIPIKKIRKAHEKPQMHTGAVASKTKREENKIPDVDKDQCAKGAVFTVKQLKSPRPLSKAVLTPTIPVAPKIFIQHPIEQSLLLASMRRDLLSLDDEGRTSGFDNFYTCKISDFALKHLANSDLICKKAISNNRVVKIGGAITIEEYSLLYFRRCVFCHQYTHDSINCTVFNTHEEVKTMHKLCLHCLLPFDANRCKQDGHKRICTHCLAFNSHPAMCRYLYLPAHVIQSRKKIIDNIKGTKHFSFVDPE